MGNTALADANWLGWITSTAIFCTWVVIGCAPSFCPSVNLVGPYGMTWSAKVDAAWEVAARYSYLNLNDGPIQGGVLSGLTLGLNWYLNTNLKFQFDWVYDRRHDRPVGVFPGFTTTYAMRMQFMY